MNTDDELARLLNEVATKGDDNEETRQRILELMRKSHFEMLAKYAEKVRYEGGNGDTLDSAVVILAAENGTVGVNAEYRYVERRFGRRELDWHLLKQRLDSSKEGRVYDVLEIQLEDGTDTEVYFDITEFFGKT